MIQITAHRANNTTTLFKATAADATECAQKLNALLAWAKSSGEALIAIVVNPATGCVDSIRIGSGTRNVRRINID